MSSPAPPANSSSWNEENSYSNNTPSDTSNTIPPNAPSSTPLASPPSLQEAQNSSPPNNSSSNSNSYLNSGSNVQASSPPAPQGQGSTQIPPTPPTPGNSNSSLNNGSPPQQSKEIPKSLSPLPSPQALNPASPVAPNASNFSSSISFPNADATPDPDSNSNSNASATPSVVSPTIRPTQSKLIIKPPPPNSITIEPSNPAPPFQPEIHFNSPVSQISTNQTTPAGLLPAITVNTQAGVKTPTLGPSSSLQSEQDSPYSKLQKYSSPNKMNWEIGPLFIVIGAVSVLMAVIYFVGKKKKKLDDLVYEYGQPAKSDGVVYQQSFHYTGSSQTDNFYGPPRMSTSSQTFSGNQQGSTNGSYQNGYYPGTQNNHTGSKSCFTYEEIMEMTGKFSREHLLGEGGFGCVYKGWLADGRCVAVKQLKVGSGQGEKEFRAEVEIISRIHHRHLVSLVGYCVVEHHRMLIYEFVPNGTLEYHLHGRGVPVMEWGKRVKIAIGSARGLAYLHEDCHPRIIHRDTKSANILLDYAFEAQVADFGLAKFTNDAHTHVSTRVMGTFGYLAPEYASSGKLTDRSDVFSFGVVLLELITGRKPVEADESLVEWARPLLVQALETGKIDELVDPRLENYYNRDEMFRMIEAAAACVRHSAPKRPRMIQVLRALDSDGAHVMDLTNGVKVGQSTAFDANQCSASEMQRFRRMVFSIEEESSKDGDTSNKPLTRSVEPNISIRDISRR